MFVLCMCASVCVCERHVDDPENRGTKLKKSNLSSTLVWIQLQKTWSVEYTDMNTGSKKYVRNRLTGENMSHFP